MVTVGKKSFRYFLILFLLTSCQAKKTQLTKPKKSLDFSIGTNLAQISDWSNDYAFIDAFKHARPWISKSMEKWDDGRQISTDENGWVKSLQLNQAVATPIFADIPNAYPSGTYTFRYKGKGKFRFFGDSFINIESEKQGEIKINLNSAANGLILEITEIDSRDYLRDMKFIFPGGVCENDITQYCDEKVKCNNSKCLKFAENTEKITFHPDFLKDISIYSTLRFMDWLNTNNSKIKSWSEISKISDYTWATQKGVPFDVIIKLVNLSKKDLWLCLPHLADDDYVEKLAEKVKKDLDPNFKIYLEYSNEVWNKQFEQGQYAEKMGKGLGDDIRANQLFYATRSKKIFEIWDRVFDNSKRLNKVVSAQAAYTEIAKVILKNISNADHLAIAPYIQFPEDFHSLEQTSLKNTLLGIEEHKKLAEQYQLELIAYEAGQHYVPGNNLEKIEFAKKINRSLKMEEIYMEYIKSWHKLGGKLFTHFYSVGGCGQYGCWGSKESHGQVEELSPKYRALKSFANK